MILNKSQCLAFSVFFITLLYPPLVFYGFMSDSVRVLLFAMILLGLFISQLLRSYDKRKIVIIIYCWIAFFIYTVASIYVNVNGAFKSTIGYSMILAFAICIFSIMQSERSSAFYHMVLKIYTSFFYVAAICAIINFFLTILTPSVNFLTGFLADNPYHYEISPFGLSVSKPIFGINFVRSFFYFIEPVYLALFYLMNIFVIGKVMPKGSNFVLINIIGGLVTFSYLFFVGYLLLKVLELRTLYRVLSILAVVLLYIGFQEVVLPGLLETSSVDNRLFRFETAIMFIQSLSMQQILFGLGIEYDYISDFGVNAGLFASLIENGVAGLIFLLTIMLLFAQKNTVLIIIVFLGLLTVEPFKLPLFWLTVILAGEVSRRNSITSLTSNTITT